MSTWEEIREFHPWLLESSEGWHQHPNGEGWVQDTASVSLTAYVGPKARVYGEAQVCNEALVYGEAHVYEKARVSGKAHIFGKTHVYGESHIFSKTHVYDESHICDKARVSGEAHVYEKARVSGEAHVYEKAQVYGEAQVYGKARVSGEAQVYGKAQVYGEARVSGEARVRNGKHPVSPIYIQGTRYWMCFSGGNNVSSGCITKPISWWLENVERCAEEHRYSETQQKEYRLHIELIRQWMELYHPESVHTEDNITK